MSEKCMRPTIAAKRFKERSNLRDDSNRRP